MELIQFGDILNSAEIIIFKEMLQRKRRVLSFSWDDLGCLDPSIEEPVKIYTTDHEPWALRPFRLSQMEWSAAVEILQERLKHGILERSEGPYAARFFLVKKKNGKQRLIQDVRNLNAVTIKDAHIPPNLDDLVDRLSGYPIYTLLDAFSGYDQIPIDRTSRDLTAIGTPLGTLRMTILPQGYTNSPAIYERIMSKILAEQKGKTVDNLLDDITVHNESRDRDDTILDNGCRMFIMDHINNVEKTLEKLINANLTISVEKAIFGTDCATALGHQISSQGRQPDPKRVGKIIGWNIPRTLKQLRGFLDHGASVGGDKGAKKDFKYNNRMD
jgi:hypothetical protein